MGYATIEFATPTWLMPASTPQCSFSWYLYIDRGTSWPEFSRVAPCGVALGHYITTCLLMLISMLWHRQAIFESKGDKLSSSAEGRIRTQRVSDTYSPADWMPADKPTELSRIKLKNLNSTARPYDQQAFSPPDPTAICHSHLALAIYIFVVVNFDALAQASDIRIERRKVVFLC